MSPSPSFGGEIPRSFPRVSGDEPDFLRTIVQFAEFSPRERG